MRGEQNDKWKTKHHRMVRRRQQNIHADPKVNNETIKIIERRFGKMTVTRGKKHVFLGMHVTYNDNGSAPINMKDYLIEAIADFSEDIVKSAATPAKRDLFDIKEDSRHFLPKSETLSTE
jgi:hypothetical protein